MDRSTVVSAANSSMSDKSLMQWYEEGTGVPCQRSGTARRGLFEGA
jgi:hypothetical protein